MLKCYLLCLAKVGGFPSSQSVQALDQSIVSDALEALNLLGYKGIQVRREIELIVSENKDIQIEELIKETLKKVK